MACPTLCLECGYLLGDVFEFIQAAKMSFYLNESLKSNIKLREVDIDKMALNTEIAKPIGFILDAAGIENICCRKAIIGFIDFDKMYQY